MIIYEKFMCTGALVMANSNKMKKKISASMVYNLFESLWLINLYISYIHLDLRFHPLWNNITK